MVKLCLVQSSMHHNPINLVSKDAGGSKMCSNHMLKPFMKYDSPGISQLIIKEPFLFTHTAEYNNGARLTRDQTYSNSWPISQSLLPWLLGILVNKIDGYSCSCQHGAKIKEKQTKKKIFAKSYIGGFTERSSACKSGIFFYSCQFIKRFQSFHSFWEEEDLSTEISKTFSEWHHYHIMNYSVSRSFSQQCSGIKFYVCFQQFLSINAKTFRGSRLLKYLSV